MGFILARAYSGRAVPLEMPVRSVLTYWTGYRL